MNFVNEITYLKIKILEVAKILTFIDDKWDNYLSFLALCDDKRYQQQQKKEKVHQIVSGESSYVIDSVSDIGIERVSQLWSVGISPLVSLYKSMVHQRVILVQGRYIVIFHDVEDVSQDYAASWGRDAMQPKSIA